MTKELQFELWKECNSNCSFCYLGKNNKCSAHDKIRSIDNVIKTISNVDLYTKDRYDTIALIGGEFFQGQLDSSDVKIKFFKLIKHINQLNIDGYIKNIWISASLLIGDQQDLYDTIDLITNKKCLWILTSYDSIGRFHSLKMEETWKYHMKRLKELYPDVKFNTTMILTGDFINKYLDDKITIKAFKKQFSTEVFLKQCTFNKDLYSSKIDVNNTIGNFFPSRKDFLKFLCKFKKNESLEDWKKLLNSEYRANTLYKKIGRKNMQIIRDKFTGNESSFRNTSNGYVLGNDYDELHDTMECNHSKVYDAYIDESGCMLCDKEIINNCYE